ncbi:MAG: hypothetical protein LBB23_05090 [Rickettsiales bacterium]|jgi:hypothetical protein|nr:hypothetical protein [Rickettsiales bacterium]
MTKNPDQFFIPPVYNADYRREACGVYVQYTLSSASLDSRRSILGVAIGLGFFEVIYRGLCI